VSRRCAARSLSDAAPFSRHFITYFDISLRKTALHSFQIYQITNSANKLTLCFRGVVLPIVHGRVW
jgi:hypothetical protein